MKLVMSICLVLLTFFMSFALVIMSLLVECDSIAVLRLKFLRSLKTRFDCFIIFYSLERLIFQVDRHKHG